MSKRNEDNTMEGRSSRVAASVVRSVNAGGWCFIARWQNVTPLAIQVRADLLQSLLNFADVNQCRPLQANAISRRVSPHAAAIRVVHAIHLGVYH